MLFVFSLFFGSFGGLCFVFVKVALLVVVLWCVLVVVALVGYINFSIICDFLHKFYWHFLKVNLPASASTRKQNKNIKKKNRIYWHKNKYILNGWNWFSTKLFNCYALLWLFLFFVFFVIISHICLLFVCCFCLLLCSLWSFLSCTFTFHFYFTSWTLFFLSGGWGRWWQKKKYNI